MRKKIIFLLVICVACINVFAEGAGREIIYVPDDYGTIQAAIDSASEGDEVIVFPGTYYETINFCGKAITVGSLFHTTQDTSYIAQTIIDGEQTNRVVLFISEEGSESLLTGFTITNGYTENCGAGIYATDYCSPTLNNLKIIDNHAEKTGGGYCFGNYCNSELTKLLVANNTAYNGAGGAYNYYCDQIMEDSVIRGNVSEHAGGGILCDEATLNFTNVVLEDNVSEYGGALYQINGEISLINVDIHGNQAETGGGIKTDGELYLENVNIVENIALLCGGGIYCSYIPVDFCEEIEGRSSIYNNESVYGIGSDIFSYYPQEIILNTFSVTFPTDYYATPVENFTFDIINGLITQIDGDVYVSANGSNENSGLSEEQPLQTIRQACALIAVSEENPHTIFLAAGTYSASATGENFPINLPDNINLQGENRESVILDAEGNSRVMVLEDVDNVSVRGLTITNGNDTNGGGIKCYQAHAVLDNLIIKGNNTTQSGGGMYLCYPSVSLSNLLIYGNTANYNGGGIYVEQSGFSIMRNVTVWGNSAGYNGGGLLTYYTQPKIVNSIFSNNEPNAISCYSTSGELSLAYSDIDGGVSEIEVYQGEMNLLAGLIYDAPQFVDAESGDFRLLAGSPCIDAGAAYLEYEGEVLVDMQEDEYWGLAPDMGTYEYVVTDSEYEEIIPGLISLYNYPNPFNPETTIRYQLTETGKVSIIVYNIRGQQVAVLLNEEQEAGVYNVNWNASDMNSGIYFISLTSSSIRQVNKAILLK